MKLSEAGLNTYAIVYCSDNRGASPLGVSIYSLFKHSGYRTAYKVYVLSNGLSAENQELIARLAKGELIRHSINFIDISCWAATAELPVTAQWPKTAWSRVFIPNLLPQESGVILYLDIDTLVCQDLSDLFATSLNGNSIGVVLEHISHEGSHFNERLNIPLCCPGYFNSGVMLMDLDLFRQHDLVRQVMQYAGANQSKLVCPDQDALNGALCHSLQPIHHKWNWHDGLTRLILKRSLKKKWSRGATLEVSVEAALYPGILHYQGANKPWKYNYRIERKRYEEAIKESGFCEYPLPGKTLIKLLKVIAYAPIYWLTWRKIKSYARNFKDFSGE